MPSCSQCQTSDTPCWREGPNGARTLCNACGIRWKRFMGRSKRSSKKTTSSSPRPAKAETPIQKPVASSAPSALIGLQPGRTTRSTTRSTRKILDHTALASKNILAMSQNELLDSILTRLDELESSQTRTTLRVRVLMQRLMKQKMRALAGKSPSSSFSSKKSEVSRFPSARAAVREHGTDPVEEGDGESEAFVLVSMRSDSSSPSNNSGAPFPHTSRAPLQHA